MLNHCWLWSWICLVAVTSELNGENRFFVPDATFAAGTQGRKIVLQADNDVTLYGFSFGINYDEAAITVTRVTAEGTLAEGADFFDGTVDSARGLVGYGCVLDLSGPFTHAILPGVDRALAKVLVDVIGKEGTSSQVKLETVPTNPDPDRVVRNVMTTDRGMSVVPALFPGTISITNASHSPKITSTKGNEGRAGTEFEVVGEFFDEPGLQVKVCGSLAAAFLEPDGQTLRVTAPTCESLGFVPLEVSTDLGFDTLAEGFNYLPPSAEKSFVRGEVNTDGHVDLSDGISILRYLFLGSEPPECIDAMDADDSGGLNITDGVYLFNYLFLGGPVIPPPYPVPGTDPTLDTLPVCLEK